MSRELDDLRKAHGKLENDMTMLEIQAAEQRMVVESKDEHLRKYKEEICHLVRTCLGHYPVTMVPSVLLLVEKWSLNRY